MTETTVNVHGMPEGDPVDPESPSGSETTGTPESSREPDYKTLYLQSKDKVEEANRMRRENAELKARLQQSPAAANGRGQARTDRDEQINRLATEFQDPLAQGHLELKMELRKELAQTIEGISQLRELDKIKDETEREETLRHFEENSHRLGDVKAAHNEIKAKKLERENEAMRTEHTRIAAELKRISGRPDPGVARTAVREVPATEHEVRLVTMKDFDAQIAQLGREGRHSEKMRLQQQLAAGKIDFKDG